MNQIERVCGELSTVESKRRLETNNSDVLDNVKCTRYGSLKRLLHPLGRTAV
jgi:hypothetical protein